MAELNSQDDTVPQINLTLIQSLCFIDKATKAPRG